VAFHDLLDAGEADARARKLAGGVQPLERVEQLAPVLGVKADAVVAYVAAEGCFFGRCRAELDQRIVPMRGELPGVPHQVLQDRADQSGISSDLDWTLDSEADVSPWLLALEISGDILDLSAEVDGLKVHIGSRKLGESQQVLDERGHLLTEGCDSLGVASAVLAECVRALFRQEAAVTR
jgi:hypothetical protein